MNLYTLALLVLTPLLVWRIYSRLKTLMARRRSLEAQHWRALVVFAALLLLMGAGLATKPLALAWFGAGAAGGIAYGIWGLRLTRYDDTGNGYYFTPNARLGILVPMQFVARVLYLGFEMYANQSGALPVPPKFDDPLTLLSFSIMAGYFASYSAGLLLWRRRLRKV